MRRPEQVESGGRGDDFLVRRGNEEELGVGFVNGFTGSKGNYFNRGCSLRVQFRLDETVYLLLQLGKP